MHALTAKRSVMIPVVILCFAFALHVFALEYDRYDDSGDDMLIRLSIVLSPLFVAVFCFMTARYYDNSRIFGRSFVVLCVSYVLVFVGEMVFFYFVDTLAIEQSAQIGELFFLCAYVFLALHMLINIRYFARRLTALQMIVIPVVSASVVISYCAVFVVYGGGDIAHEQFQYNLVFVCASSLILGLCVVSFFVFASTVMTTAWLVLLVGIAIGTVGDLSYNYAYALGTYGFEDVSGPLWNASHVTVAYALYLHRQYI